ncbi:MAG: hypothetical protein ACOCQA_00370 [bacterium]
MSRPISPRKKEKLRLFFTGEIERKANLMKNKLNQELPDRYYCTLGSVSYVNTRNTIKNSGHVSDPTGSRATDIADIILRRKRAYNYYSSLLETIKIVTAKLTENQLYLTKIYVEVIEGTITKGAEELGFSYTKAQKELRYALKLYDKKIPEVFYYKK